MVKAITLSRVGRCAFIVLGAVLHTQPGAASPSENPIAVAVRHGDCGTAVDLINQGAAAKDGQSAYLAGRMLDEGICVVQNIQAAASYFAQGAELGDRAASLEYGAKVGLGEGVEQDYERAGEICRHAGLDPEARMPAYALGYACTVRGVAGRLLRERLPADAFRPNSGALRVAFNPAVAHMLIQETPRVVREDSGTGSMLGKHRIDARRSVEEAWSNALEIVPKPDAKRLVSQSIDLSVDVDMTLQSGQLGSESGKRDVNVRTLMPYELLRDPSVHR